MGVRRVGSSARRLPKLPWKVTGYQYRSKRTGKLVRKSKSAKREPVYKSLATGKRISKGRRAKTYLEQSALDLFPKIKHTENVVALIREYQEAGSKQKVLYENRYPDFFNYLRDKGFIQEEPDVRDLNADLDDLDDEETEDEYDGDIYEEVDREKLEADLYDDFEKLMFPKKRAKRKQSRVKKKKGRRYGR